MKTLLVQDFLLHKSFAELKETHSVSPTLGPNNRKISLNYSQLETKDDDVLAQDCRGLILAKYNDVEFNLTDNGLLNEDIVVGKTIIKALPFKRFFNYGQEAAVDIDWSTARFEDKKDGSLIIGYVDTYQNKWCCATRKMCEAHGVIQDSDLTFAHLVNVAAQRYGATDFNDFMNRGSKDWHTLTFKFELTSPYNRIVCKYDEIGLTLLGVRNNISFEEYDTYEYAKTLGVFTPEEFHFSNINHMIQVVREWNPQEKEGIVAVDYNFNRIKVKNPSYVAFNRLHDSLATSWRGCAEVILLGTEDDVIPMMPEMIANRIIKLKPLVAKVLHQTQEDYDRLKSIDDMKTFALSAQKCLWPAALFALKRGKTPDLRTFAIGNNRSEKASIPKPALETMLELCKKLDPTLKEVETDD